ADDPCDTAEGRDHAQRPHAAECEGIEAAAEQEDAERHGIARPAQRRRGGQVEGERADGQQRQRMPELILHRRLINAQQIGRELAAQRVRPEGAEHDARHAGEGAEKEKELGRAVHGRLECETRTIVRVLERDGKPRRRVEDGTRGRSRPHAPHPSEAMPMAYNLLPGTDLRVSRICLGTMTWGEQTDAGDAHAQLDLAVARGINFIDTAEMYPIPPCAETQGRTERIFGDWLARQQRDRLIVASKVAGPGRREWLRGGRTELTKANIAEAIDGTLKRLRTDYIDLYQIHWPDRAVPMFGKTMFVPRE